MFREGISHSIWENPKNGKRTAVPRHKEIIEFTVNSICRQLEIPLP
ncbi:MAG: type II toxin-antitoxin system HicA family toxin [Pyrinomonadaceae bacterium]